jgi:hypothetical protein
VISGLREALRTEADRAAVYVVYERALRTARRRRRNRLSAIAAATAVLVVLVLTVIPAGMAAIEAPPPAASGSEPSLPDRLAFPPAFWPEVSADPAGPASLVFGGQGFAVDRPGRLRENEGDFAVVGATSDVYRMLRVTGYEAHAGEDVLLSPAGGQLAIPSGMSGGPAILDLTTGRQTHLSAFTANDYVTPLAWSPDGRTLAVEVVFGEDTRIGLVDVPDGSFRTMSGVARDSYERGFAVAFAADGQRWAYQDDGYVVIASLEPKLLERVPLDGGWLAGKGAFAPDGIVTLKIADGQWRLGGSRQWTVGGLDLAAVRLIGWTGGQPVVVVYKKEPGAPASDRPVTAYQAVHSIEVWRLTETGHDVLLTAPHNLMSIDVADTVLASGRVRIADPPTTGIGTVLAVALPVLVVAVVGWRLRRRLSSGRTRPGAAR